MSPKSWLERHSSASVGVILANGWLGRPSDNHDQIDTFSLSKGGLELDCGKGLHIKVRAPRLSVEQNEHGHCLVLSLSKKS